MNNSIKKVGIVGCGKILPAHLRAIDTNRSSFKLVALCDSDKNKLDNISLETGVRSFAVYENMLSEMKNCMDMVVIATPNYLHYTQAKAAIENGYSILVEKPVSFESRKVKYLTKLAKKNNVDAFGVLQVRYNPSVRLLKKAIDGNLFGKVRSVSLVQRWQRPPEYFDGWRGDAKLGGRILYEIGIHYLDILQLLFGVPQVIATKTFNVKYDKIPFEDTLFSIFNFGSHCAGSAEITLAAEPCNLECSISIIAENGSVKLNGKALEKIELASFVEETLNIKQFLSEIKELNDSVLNEYNDYGKYLGSSPNHPTLYSNIANGEGINLDETSKAISFIEQIYKKEII